MIARFALTVMYTQIVVATIGAPPRELAWTDAHVAQGFAWSPTMVAFGVPDHDGQVTIEIDRRMSFRLDPEALWAVKVPYEVTPASVEVGTILDERPVPVAAGRYDLVFEALPGSHDGRDVFAYVLRLTFVPSAVPSFEILKRGMVLSTDRVLRPDAMPTR